MDISEFRCTAADPSGVVVVFSQTNRRYTYLWHGTELAIARPTIEGDADPHPPEVLDCLARAVAYHAGKTVYRSPVRSRW